jgi:U3 small nucleolar RNA-associated protein 25
MDKKSLLEDLRELTSEVGISEKDEPSIKDIVDDEDRYVDDEEDTYEEDQLEDEERMEHDEEDDEEDFDMDGDGEEDDVHSLYLLKSAFNATDDEDKHILVSFAKMLLDNDIDLASLGQFVEEIDYEDEEDMEDELNDEDIFDDDVADFEEEEDEEEEEESSEEDEELEEDLSSADRTFFTNEAAIIDIFDTNDMGDLID